MSTTDNTGGGQPDLVLVVDDEPTLGEHIAYELTLHGHRALHTANYAEAMRMVLTVHPRVVVLDQIVESQESSAFLRSLDALTEHSPWVVLLRYERGPTGPFRNLRVTVVGGEEWFDELPPIVRRLAPSTVTLSA